MKIKKIYLISIISSDHNLKDKITYFYDSEKNTILKLVENRDDALKKIKFFMGYALIGTMILIRLMSQIISINIVSALSIIILSGYLTVYCLKRYFLKSGIELPVGTVDTSYLNYDNNKEIKANKNFFLVSLFLMLFSTSIAILTNNVTIMFIAVGFNSMTNIGYFYYKGLKKRIGLNLMMKNNRELIR